MKIQIILIGLLMFSGSLLGQTPPSAGGEGSNSIQYWSRSGNNANSSQNNIFGTRWNSPIYTITGGIGPTNRRMKVNGVFINQASQYTINTYGWNQGVNTTGYVLIGNNNNSMTGGANIYSEKGAFSMLHLNGPGSVFQEYGYRPWMKTGITMTGNKDLSYFGLRKLSTNESVEDITETVIMWSDNNGSSEGPDHLVFRFSGHGGNDKETVSSNRLSNTDLDGLHVATYTGTGFMGLGNTFGTNASGMMLGEYINPMSIMHTSYDYRSGGSFSGYGFHQITYRRDGTTTIGTGETADDGLRWGIDNTLFTTQGTQHLNAYFRWQENSPLIFQTDWDNTAGGTNQGERLRVLSTGSPNVPAATLMGTNVNVSRVAISYIGSAPITQPRTLLHMGTNNAGVPAWMEYGAMVANASQAAFLGVTPTGYSDPNQNVVGFTNANLVFIGDPGETGRFSNSNGFLGVGDFGPNGLNVNPQQRIDVDGNGRFRNVPANSGQSIILGIEQGGNPDDIILSRLEFPDDPTVVLQGDGSWGPAGAQGPQGIQGEQGPAGPQGPIGLTGAQGPQGIAGVAGPQGPIGLTGPAGPQGIAGVAGPQGPIGMTGPAGAQGPIGLTGPQGPQGITGATGATGPQGPPGVIDMTCEVGGVILDNNSMFNLNNNNFYFTHNEAIDQNHVGIGYDCDEILPAKLSVIQTHPSNVDVSTTTISAINEDVSEGNFGSTNTAVLGHSTGVPVSYDVYRVNRGGDFFATNSFYNNGVFAYVIDGVNPESVNEAGLFRAFGGQRAAGVISNAAGASDINYGVLTIANNGEEAYGIYADANGAATNYAGYFVGNGVYTGTWTLPSDSTLKYQITKENNILPLVSKLRPVNYFMKTDDYDYMNLSEGIQHGFISQEIQTIFPELVKTVIHPAQYDSIGVEISPRTEILGLNYESTPKSIYQFN